MEKARWQEIDRMLDAALERAPDERAAFLMEACGEDEALRHEVETLLAAHAQADSFLMQPVLTDTPGQFSLIGQQLGHYQVIELLGAGGMGEVYLARDTRLERKVALKLLPKMATQDAERLKRFAREARAASALNHPNIITIYEIDEQEATHFIAAEFVDGQTLRALCGRALPVKDVLETGMQIAAALAAAHEAGIIHRDIKPENVMLRRDGYVKVLDFGLAKLVDRHASHVGWFATRDSSSDLGRTNPGVILGTVRYMSPEQALGEEVDRRTDIFSLGVVLYEMLAGVSPFKGATAAETFDAIVHHTPLPLTQLNPELPAELARILQRALEKDRDLRYQTVADLRADLKRLQRELNSAAPLHSSGAAPARRRTLDGSRAMWVTGGISIALVCAALLWWWQNNNKGAVTLVSWNNAHVKTQTEFPGNELFPSLSPDGTSLVYARWNKDNWDIFWQRVGGAQPRNLTENSSADDTQPTFSPDGESIAFRSERDGGGIFVMGASGESVRRLSDKGFAYHPNWAPDSRSLLYTEEEVIDPRDRAVREFRLWSVNVATAEKHVITNMDVAQPAWSPHGRRIAYWNIDKLGSRNIWTMRPDGQDPMPVTSDAATDWNPIWSPDGTALYFVSDRTGNMQFWQVPIDEVTGQTLGSAQLVPTPAAASQHLSFSRDGRRLAYAQVTPRYQLQGYDFDPARGTLTKETQPLVQGSRTIFNPSVAPDGKRIAYYGIEGSQEDLFLVNSDGSSAPQQITDEPSKKRAPVWSPNGKRLAFYSNRSGNWEIWAINADGSNMQQMSFIGQRGLDAFFPLWSTDGTKLLYLARQRQPFRVFPYSLETAQPQPQQTPQLLYTRGEEFPIFWARTWSPDGKRLAGAIRKSNDLDGNGAIYDIATQQITHIKAMDLSVPFWLADNRRLLIYQERKLSLLDSFTQQSKELLNVGHSRLNGVTLSPDNRKVYLIFNQSEADICLLTRTP